MDNYNILLRERQEYENQLYDYLVPINNGRVNVAYFIYSDSDTDSETLNENDSFWDPVIVNLSESEINSIPDVCCQEMECNICTDHKTNFKMVKCCNNKICTECIETWFNKSVYCPYCKQDQREIK
jgi:hypothetical protein